MNKIGDTNMYYYQRLKDIREDNDKTQSEIASILKISQSHYSQYELGKRELPMHHFITLANYYNISLDYLAGLIRTPKPIH
jgi:transcriptional regulator with XRE-family HTH domain